jgi:hypothetical protein
MKIEALVDAISGVGLFGRQITNNQKLRTRGLVLAASVMHGRGQSSIAYDIIAAAYALNEVPMNHGVPHGAGDYLATLEY